MSETFKTWNQAIEYCVNRIAARPANWGDLRELYNAYKPLDLAAAAWTIIRSRDVELTGDDVLDLLIRKQSDYGSANIMRFGEEGLKVRLWDKIARYENLTKGGQDALNESIEDTLVDIIGYVALLLMVQNGWMELPLDSLETPLEAPQTVVNDEMVPEPPEQDSEPSESPVEPPVEPPLQVEYVVYGKDTSATVVAIGFNTDSAGNAWFIRSTKPGDVQVYAAGSWVFIDGE